ncbi:DNA helicase [Trifolium repens]|nr:DNA helicase [Trifolium repens]
MRDIMNKIVPGSSKLSFGGKTIVLGGDFRQILPVGQTLSNVGLYLPRPVFTHGQLYVAVSRVKTRKGLKILALDDSGVSSNSTINIVYEEVFRKI